MKRVILLIVLALLTYESASGQIKFDDPFTIIKDPDGKILSKDDIQKIMESGSEFTMFQTKKGDTTIYHLRYLSKTDIAESKMLRTDIIKAFENKQMIPFRLKTLGGEIVSESSLKGKVTVMNFWFTGCKPCIREMPSLNNLVYKYGDSVNFYAPTFNSPNEVEAFLKRLEFKYQSLPDSKEFNEDMGISVYPTHLIIDKEGIVRKVIFGASEDIELQLDKEIQLLLN